ncbi:MAG: hypothetical protein JWN86_4659 [Planctomycetota bacterium]|nr:hypothetical protein [Planctomycetota bacterium]
MSRPRISIASLLIVVVVVAMGLAALRAASYPWAGAFTSLTYFALLASWLGIAFGRGRRRVFWTGFALLGWGYVVLSHSSWMGNGFRSFLLAPNLSASLFEILHPEEAAGAGMGGMGNMGGGMGGGMRNMPLAGGGAPPTSAIDLTAFTLIGTALEALLWAFLGGWTARYFASARPTTPAT